MASVSELVAPADSAAAQVRIGSSNDDLERLGACGWMIEAAAENLEIKRASLANVSSHLHQDAILTTSISGLPVAKIAEQLPADERRPGRRATSPGAGSGDDGVQTGCAGPSFVFSRQSSTRRTR